MYRLMIVEDEPIERQGLKLMLEHNCNCLSQIFEASDGMEAIKHCKSFAPDIVLIDINMPGINGLDTIRTLREINSDIHFVILTSQNRFEYAHEAIGLNVEEYILKPARIAKLKETIEKIAKKIGDTSIINHQQTMLATRIKRILPILERDCVYSLISEPELNNLDIFDFLDFEVKAGCCFIVKANNNGDRISQTIKHLASLGFTTICENMGGQDIYFILFKEIPSADSLSQWITFATVHYPLPLHLGIGSLSTTPKTLHDSYIKALSLFQLQNTYEKENNINVDELLKELQHSMVTKDLFNQKTAELALVFQNANQPTDAIMQNLLEQFSKWINQQMGRNVVAVISPINSHATLHEKIVSFQKQLNDLAQPFWNKENNFAQTLVGRVLSYIHQHFAENITLDSLSEEFHVSPYYISRLIKNKLGSSFPDILANYRIKEAKIRLAKGDSIKEVTYKVGFSSQNYFGKTFKKITGFTPSEYKDQL